MKKLIIAVAAALLSTAASAQVVKVSPPRTIIDIDPHGPNALLRESVLVARQIFETLVKFDGDQPVPVLAESWKQIDDKTGNSSYAPASSSTTAPTSIRPT